MVKPLTNPLQMMLEILWNTKKKVASPPGHTVRSGTSSAAKHLPHVCPDEVRPGSPIWFEIKTPQGKW